MHVSFVLILNKCITSWLSRILIKDHYNFLDGSINLELSTQLGLGCVVILEKRIFQFQSILKFIATYHSSNKKSFEGIFRRFLNVVWIPYSDFSFELICNLFCLFLSSSLNALLFCLDSRWWRCIFWILLRNFF